MKNRKLEREFPDFRKVIRCPSCAAIYKARPLPMPKDRDLSYCTDAADTGDGLGRWLAVASAECPRCYALFAAEFSLC